MRLPRLLCKLQAVAATLVILAPQAQAPPDAGALRQQIDQGRQPVLPRKATPVKPAEPAAMLAQAGTVASVKSFRFAGNTLLTAEQLAPAVAVAYREAGWVVRAYLPRQDITGGIVTIQIVEAVFGGLHFEGDVPRRMNRIWRSASLPF